MWIYRYLRADRVEIDIGPYNTEEKAEADRKQHASFGAITFGPLEVADDYKLYKDEVE